MNIVQNKTKPVPSWQQVENMEKGNYLVRYTSKAQYNSFCFSICNFGLLYFDLMYYKQQDVQNSVVQNVIGIGCNTVGAKRTEYLDVIWGIRVQPILTSCDSAVPNQTRTYPNHPTTS